MLGRLGLFCGLLVLTLAAFASLPAQNPPPEPPPVGLDRRIPWTSSRVVGSPDAPPPFRVRKAFERLHLDHPIHAVRQPGTDQYLVITQKRSYGPSKLQRFRASNPAFIETLLDLNATAYDLVFHPNFAENGYFFLGLNGPSKGAGPKKTQILRYTMDRNPPYLLDAAPPKVIIEWESDGHNGGAMAFGKDGLFYVTSGDGTSDSDRNLAGQNMASLLSKVLRIDIERPQPGKSYSVPADNPFVGVKNTRPEIWAYGTRNPWRMTVDAKTGHLWIGNNGQDLWEQAYLVKKGDNFGWSVNEGSHPFYPNRAKGPTPIVPPTIEHHHVESRSLTGGVVYYGARFPELVGAYIYGDYSTGKIWAMKHDGEKPLWHKEIADSRLQITGFAIDDRGELLICDHRGDLQGTLYTLERTVAEANPTRFPKTLSETGLFASVKGHVVDPGVIPYSIVAPFWGDHAKKERWIALPGATSQITLAYPRGWNFPDGTVIVKSFALDLREGDPASRRWIETRLLTRQHGEWFGYSYAWNDEQTDATLVEGQGRDRKVTIVEKAGAREQTWHFPSRTECMVCHSRAANWTLGIQTLQMNKDHNYGGRVANQLRTLAHIGAIKPDWTAAAKQVLNDDGNAAGMSDFERETYIIKNLPAGGTFEEFLKLVSTDNHRLVDPFDVGADLTRRARSYLHVNCSQCHVEAGGGNAAFDVEFVTPLNKMKLIDAQPVHDRFGIANARLIAPGRPEDSVLLRRISCRGPGQMPPLATSIVDDAGVELLRGWVKQLGGK